jgi:sugar-specific transcriptional regulator TrmB
MSLEILRKIGLTDGEIKVYSAVLEIGAAQINRIHEKTGIERRNIYDILNKLISKGLITYIIEKGKKQFQVTHPNKIISYLEEEKHRIDETKKEIEDEIPSIIRKFESGKPAIRAEVYRGKEGIKAIFEDMLNYKENYFIGGGWYIVKELPYFWANYNRRRKDLGVKWFNLVRYELKKEKIPEKKLMSVKFLPMEFSGNPHVVFIYGNKVVNVLWGKEFFAFMTESKEINENYKRYFDFLWNRANKK